MLIDNTEHDTALAPGCFGSPIIYRATGAECSTCLFMQQCAPQSIQRRALLHKEYGIQERKPAKQTVRFDEATMTLPKKVADLAGRIMRAGLDVAGDMRAGRNPFAQRPAFLKIVCHILIALPLGASRKQLVYALQTKLGWKPETAAAHTLQAVQLLMALGAVRDIDGMITIRRDA